MSVNRAHLTTSVLCLKSLLPRLHRADMFATRGAFYAETWDGLCGRFPQSGHILECPNHAASETKSWMSWNFLTNLQVRRMLIHIMFLERRLQNAFCPAVVETIGKGTVSRRAKNEI